MDKMNNLNQKWFDDKLLSNLSHAKNNPSLAYKRALKSYILESLNKDDDK